MAALFISDLHLRSSSPRKNAIFFDFLGGKGRQTPALYILGDLFDYWAGDDELDDPFNAAVVAALARCSASTEVYFLPGNRDFLIGKRFAALSGVRLIDDPTLVEIDGVPTLLAHGDTLCTEDTAYQRFRSEVRSPDWISAFLAKPREERRRQIQSLREQSESEKRQKPDAIMDVSIAAVASLLKAHGYPRLIHGHTHRGAHHQHVIDGRRCERWVLSDWREQGSVLVCEGSECRVELLGPAP